MISLFSRSAILCALMLSFAGAHGAESLADVARAIVPVANWGGTPADAAKARQHKISHITLHHQGEPFKPGTDPEAYLRRLQAWSRAEKGWLDIPYHYVIDLDGRIYGARDIAYAGDTNTEYDPSGHALIEVVGNFEEVEPNRQQLDAAVKLARKSQRGWHLPTALPTDPLQRRGPPGELLVPRRRLAGAGTESGEDVVALGRVEVAKMG